MENQERVPKLIKFPIDLYIRIEEYQKHNEIKDFSKAVYQLIREGLEHSDN